MDPTPLIDAAVPTIFLGALLFALTVSWLHIARPDLLPRDEGISHYAVGRIRVPMTAALVALAAALLGAALSLAERVQAPSQIGPVALTLAGVGLLLVAARPVAVPEQAVSRRGAHAVGALAFLIGSAVGTAALSGHLDRPAGPIAVGLAVLVGLLVAGMAGTSGLRSVHGRLERGCFSLVVAWLLTVAWQLAS